MNRPLGTIASCLVAASLIAGCDNPSPSREAAAAPSSSAPRAEQAGASASPSVAAARPGMKEFEATPAERLGRPPSDVGVPVGQPAPDATVHDAKGREVRLAELVKKSSGKTHHTFAIPAQFLIDKGGVVRWAHADPDYKVRPRTAQILAAIDAAGLAAR